MTCFLGYDKIKESKEYKGRKGFSGFLLSSVTSYFTIMRRSFH